MAGWQKLGLKIFLEEPLRAETQEFIPAFHSWIQSQAVDGHLLIDVHDYSHIHRGPGILLVAHEGNFSLDQADDRPGLLYHRKQNLDGNREDCIREVFRHTLLACSRLESDPVLGGRVRFHTREMLLLANDRLHTPNSRETFERLRPELTQALSRILGRGVFSLDRVEDPRELFSVWVRARRSFRPGYLLRRFN